MITEIGKYEQTHLSLIANVDNKQNSWSADRKIDSRLMNV